MVFGLTRTARGFGLLSYSHTTNLGDEMQSLAARAFLPRVDRLVDRDALDRRSALRRAPAKLILNGWFTHRPDRWPPHPSLAPLIVSLHLSDFVRGHGFSAAEALVVGRNAQYFRDHGPVGVRDLWTLDLMQRNGIDSYFSGCLTLTLARPVTATQDDCIVLNDVSDEIEQAVRGRTGSRVVRSTHENTSIRGFRERSLEAQRLLELYAGARCVMTSRLHCALPCLAIGTPVLLILPASPSNRFSGLRELTNHCTQAEFIGGRMAFDLEQPPVNPQRHLRLAHDLRTRCEAYIGDSPTSPGRRER